MSRRPRDPNSLGRKVKMRDTLDSDEGSKIYKNRHSKGEGEGKRKEGKGKKA